MRKEVKVGGAGSPGMSGKIRLAIHFWNFERFGIRGIGEDPC
jgi:hypothetical protein